jgi:Protein of unknown function (DUF2723)
MTKLHFYSTLAALTLLGLIGRALLAPGYFEDFDSLYFARSLEHYSVAALSPHWPGYPVFVWSIRLAHLFTPDPNAALHAVSVIAVGVTAVPVALITLEIARLGQSQFGHAFETALEFGAGFSLKRARIAGLIAAVLWTLVPITWIDGTEALSDPLAGLVTALFLWAYLRTLERPQPGRYALVGVFAGLLPGVRLAGILLLAPLGLLGWWAIRERRWSNLFWLLGSTVLTVAVWFGWQISQEGLSWFSTGRQMLGQLSPDWVPEATESNLWGQLVRYTRTTLELGLGGGTLGALTDGNSRGVNGLSNGLFSGLSSGLLIGPSSFARPLISIGWMLALMAGTGVLLRGRQRPALVLLASMVLPHLIWVLRSRDLSSARYAIPIVLVLVVVAGLGIASIAGRRVGQNGGSPRPRPNAKLGWRAVLSGLLISGWAALIAIVTVPLALEHKTSLPIEQQIAAYLQPVSAVHPVTFFGTHSMLFWDAAQLPVDVVYAPLEVLEKHTGRPGEVFLTTIGTEKGASPTTQPPKRWRAVAQFCRNRFLRARTRDPIELVLYQHLLEGQPISNLLPKRECQDRTSSK